jgi:hypothetical protein
MTAAGSGPDCVKTCRVFAQPGPIAEMTVAQVGGAVAGWAGSRRPSPPLGPKSAQAFKALPRGGSNPTSSEAAWGPRYPWVFRGADAELEGNCPA